MNLAVVEQIARAVLYEGYMLYPYRPSSVKNRQRWNFGVLYPQSYAAAQSGADAYQSRTECLVQPGAGCTIEVRGRFLQLVERTIGRMKVPRLESEGIAESDFEVVDRLQVAGQLWQPWQEAEEREVALALSREELLAGAIHRFTFAPARKLEPVREQNGAVSGVIIRDSETVTGALEISAVELTPDLLKLTVRFRNATAFDHIDVKTRDQALASSLLSAHVVLGVSGGEFISLLEPPLKLREFAAQCQNIGTWPVLVGEAGQRDTMLSSPIILYDYPHIAPESAGDLFDGTEIDEILSLRIMTLTDGEKREMRESDERMRQMLARTESLPPEQLMKMHGVVRSLRPLKEEAS